MNKGLEALQDIRLRIFIESEVQSKKIVKDLKTIEKELKDYEQLQEDYDNLKEGYDTLSFQYDRLKYQKESQNKAFDTLSKDHEKAMKELSKEIEKNRALNEILALHDKWLGYKMSDFEFFTLLAEIKNKYGLSKEVLL